MRLPGFIGVLLLFGSFVNPSNALNHDLVARQATITSSTTSTPVTTSSPTATSTSQGSDSSSESSSSTKSTASAALVPSLSSSGVPIQTIAPNNITTPGDPIPLPLLPSYGPGNIIAGIFMIITSLIYIGISIKYQLVHNFMSVAYVGALAVTCLIVFVENPGSSSAQHAGYAIGVILAAVVMGGLSSPFANITEGLGCFLGGFCLAMWFLCLNDGGLIRNRAGKVIFITAMSGGIGALSMFQFTRRLALIGCISFSGATAFILGVDCFTLSGLKEFWLYIWEINMNIFPLDTNTYPFTRGIKVEIGCIIVIFIFGILRNANIWQKLRTKKLQQDAENERKEYRRSRIETVLGRRTEMQVARERQQWEKLYGPPQPEPPKSSGTGTDTLRRLSSISHTSKDPRSTIELVEIEAGVTIDDPLARITRKVDEAAGITINIEGQGNDDDHKAGANPRPSSEIFSRNFRQSQGSSRSFSTRSSAIPVPTQNKTKSITNNSNESKELLSGNAVEPSSPLSSSFSDKRTSLILEQAAIQEALAQTMNALEANKSTSAPPVAVAASDAAGKISATVTTEKGKKQADSVLSPRSSTSTLAETPKKITIVEPKKPVQETKLSQVAKPTLLAQRETKIEQNRASSGPYTKGLGADSNKPSLSRGSTIDIIKEEDGDEDKSKTTRKNQSKESKHRQSRGTSAVRRSTSHNALQERSRSQPRSQSKSRPTSQSRSKSQNRSSTQSRGPERPSMYLNNNSSHRLSSQSQLINHFNSHQPDRRENDPTPEDRAAQFAQWHGGLEQMKHQPERFSGLMSANEHRAAMIHDKRVREQQVKQQEFAKQQFGAAVDQTMRRPDGMARHASRLSAMQAQVKFD